MIGERIALLLGLFGAPAALLWLGHRLRDRSARQRGAFWGGAIGHGIAIVVAVIAALFPPIWWHEGGVLRDFAVHWSMLIGAVAGGAAGALRATAARAQARADRRASTDRRTGEDRRTTPPHPAARPAE